MTCRRAFEIDLAAFMMEPRAPEWNDFRAHYPRCVDCAAEVRAWTELGTQLDGGHPAPDVLVRLQDTPASLDPAERARLATHVAACATCADELRALRGMAAVIPTRHATPARAATPRPRRFGLAALGRLAWHPAVAYAVLVVTAVPLLLARRHEVGLVVRQDAAPPPAQPVPAPPPAAKPAPAEAEPEGRRLLGALEREAPRADRRAQDDDGLAERDESAADAEHKAKGHAPPPPPAAAPAQSRARLADEATRASGDVADQANRASGTAAGGAAPDAPAPGAAPDEPALRAAPAELARRAAPGDTTRGAAPGVHLARTGDVVVLQTARPADVDAGTTVDVRVVDDARGRELRERVTLAAAAPLALRVPATWLAAGAYRLEVRAGSRVQVTPFTVP